MARKRKPPRLYLHPRERCWIIRDGNHFERTGCSERDRGRADRRLARYIDRKYRQERRETKPENLVIAELLAAYGLERGPKLMSPRRAGFAIQKLLPFWGARPLTDVNRRNCVEYAERRGVEAGTIRRELGVLSAAIRYWHKSYGPLEAIPVVTVPDMPLARQDFLTRSEAAWMLAGALGFYRRTWSVIETGEECVEWRRDPARINRHLARFIVLGLYTGTRSGAVKALQWERNTEGGFIDFAAGIMHRAADGELQTKKRKPPVKLGRRPLAHLRRWRRISTCPYVVDYGGGKIEDLRTAWASMEDLAQLGRHVTPHILRHTRATWLMQAKTDKWEAAGHLGMSLATLERVYGHHSPDWQAHAAEV